jgi:hypothetical protein
MDVAMLVVLVLVLKKVDWTWAVCHWRRARSWDSAIGTHKTR